ncbi:hypothetical protein IEQ34_023106 [Dendrobium chrysotoxum]|uniref:Uncharacterized protein n=1 Tax=Dendrobium chrysotoxum TaxID=161865 RepID=A0AAV7FZB4_DENCH|nr:hypothetical protein IEQ34_023106 [Dendrobium chrysotoxum]
MEGSKAIREIVFTCDDRFYAIGSDWELYMLDERPPLIRLRRIKLWLRKHILGIDHDDNLVENVLATWSNRMTESGETNLIIYGPYCGHSLEINMISLKINVAKLRVNSNNINVACDVELSFSCEAFPREAEGRRKRYFTPSLRNITQS